MLAGITRVRNESLILEDTLKHMLERVDHIYLYDDASTDNTVEIATSFNNVTVTMGYNHAKNRDIEETRHRRIMMSQAKQAGAEWIWCFDADERFIGDLPDMTADGYRVHLFDGYITPEYAMEYAHGKLEQLPRMWGPERRDILMLFRADKARYIGLDQREPVVDGRIADAGIYCKHFGKCISFDQFKETCLYYARWDKYRAKWLERMKQGPVHRESDFERELYHWEELMVSPEKQVRI